VAETVASAKLLRIKSAAVWAVMPISSSHADLPEADVAELTKGLERFFRLYGQDSPTWVSRHLARKMAYAADHTEVELAAPADGETYGEREDLSVSLRHTFHLAVPYANWLFSQFDGDDGVLLDFGDREYGLIIRASCRLSNEGVRDYIDIESFPQ
ncbi:MAG: hypothetical protein SVT52_04005, partial [Planctomycetota bacterium]|nr:hypothetical protein [Planctomycetota bacterium]